MRILLLAFCFMLWCFDLKAQEQKYNNSPTVVEAIANNAEGGKNVAIVEQPDGYGNPLGNPIVGPYVAPRAYNAANALNENKVQNYNNYYSYNRTNPNSALSLGRQFRNTLMEANGEIYDIQAYPDQDIGVIGNKILPQTIYSPNVN